MKADWESSVDEVLALKARLEEAHKKAEEREREHEAAVAALERKAE